MSERKGGVSAFKEERNCSRRSATPRVYAEKPSYLLLIESISDKEQQRRLPSGFILIFGQYSSYASGCFLHKGRRVFQAKSYLYLSQFFFFFFYKRAVQSGWSANLHPIWPQLNTTLACLHARGGFFISKKGIKHSIFLRGSTFFKKQNKNTFRNCTPMQWD